MTGPPAAEAFAPGHVTGFFSVHRRETPARTGSRGAGLTLADGVTAALWPAEEASVTLDGGRTVAPAESALDALGVTARVECASDLPPGAGFGVSGAATLATALAANAAFDLERSENELVRVAHSAEVRAGTGLGDVVAQARGGAPVRLEPGAPPHGRLDGVPGAARVEYLSLGELSTAEVLSGDTDRLSEAGERALAALRERPTLPRLVALSREFAVEADLLADDVRSVVEAVTDAGGSAAMVMLGRSVFALDGDLSAAGYDPRACSLHHAGARVLS